MWRQGNELNIRHIGMRETRLISRGGARNRVKWTDPRVVEIKCLRKLGRLRRQRVLETRCARCQGGQSAPTLSSSQRDFPERPNIGLDWNCAGEPRGAPVGRVLSYSCACTWGSTEVPLGDAQSERHRSSCGRFQDPWASVRSALRHTVACARIPRHYGRTVACCCC